MGPRQPEADDDPRYLRDLLLYRLTIEAQKRASASPLSKREITRRLDTSAAQLYRLPDQTNYRKSIDQLLALLQVLNCEVDLVVRTKRAESTAAKRRPHPAGAARPFTGRLAGGFA